MRAYCRLGQRHTALAQYAACGQTLQAELGVEPMAETLALREAIVEGRFECSRNSDRAVLAASLQRRETARHPLNALADVPLVGREQDLAFLADGWLAALNSGCSLLLISGEAAWETRLAQRLRMGSAGRALAC